MIAAAGNNLDGLAFLIPFAIMGIVVLVALVIANLYHNRRLASLNAVAALWNGRVFNPGLFSPPHAELRIGNTVARLQFTTVSKHGFTELTIHFPDERLRLEIYPQTIVHQVRKLLGMQDIEVGVRSFDDAFIIQGNSPQLIREYFTLEAQAALQGLADFTFYHNLHLNIGGRTLRVTKRNHLSKERELVQFVSHFERLFTALLEARTLGIEFLPTTIPARGPDSHCQVCGAGLQGKIVYCNACHTPHHLDCWQYIGHCSVYACGQRRYRGTA